MISGRSQIQQLGHRLVGHAVGVYACPRSVCFDRTASGFLASRTADGTPSTSRVIGVPSQSLMATVAIAAGMVDCEPHKPKPPLLLVVPLTSKPARN
jgi:hypothetical protein